MKLKSLILAIVAVVIGSASMSAQTAKEVQETVARMESSSALCNKGPEAFKTFIEKFSTDEEFMNSRIKLENEAQRTEFAELFVDYPYLCFWYLFCVICVFQPIRKYFRKTVPF